MLTKIHTNKKFVLLTYFRYQSYLVCGLASLANTNPTINAWKRHPITLWSDMTMMASVHSFVVCLLPYPIVCCVSFKNVISGKQLWSAARLKILLMSNYFKCQYCISKRTKEKRNAEAKSSISKTHGFQLDSSCLPGKCSGRRSPWYQQIR